MNKALVDKKKIVDDDGILLLDEEPTKIKKKRKNTFRLSSKNFFLTYPQCDISREDCMLQLKRKRDPEYVLVSQEQHEDGDPHLHALLQYKIKLDIRNEKYFDLINENDVVFHGNYQAARSSDQTKAYVMKDGFYIESGEYISNKQSEVQKRAKDNKLILTSSLPKLVDQGHVSIYSYQQLRTAKNLYTLDSLEVPDYMPKECIWIYGPTGIGKSRYIRDNYPGLFFNKSQNKWWDGYNGEKIVLLDDFDLKGEQMGHLLKIWADCYSFTAEIKGGTIKPVIEKFFITSQYLPKDIWCHGKDQEKWDDELRQAIERRFKIMTIDTDGKTLINY